MTDMIKICSKCKIEKNIQSFPTKGYEIGRLPRFSSECKLCKKKRMKEYFKKKSDAKKALLPLEPAPLLGFKICRKCKESKPKNKQFFHTRNREKDRFNSMCKECVLAPRRLAVNTNRKPRPELSNKTENIYARNRRKKDILYRLSKNLRNRMGHAVKKGNFTKKSSLSKYLGCTMKKFKAYLESLFQSGMNWDNYGNGNDKWNIDHIIPLASAKTVKDLYRLSHFTNLQPMWQPENITKSDKMPEEMTTFLAALYFQE